MTYDAPNDLKARVREDRVHRSITTDPDILQLEMGNRRTYRAWLNYMAA